MNNTLHEQGLRADLFIIICFSISSLKTSFKHSVAHKMDKKNIILFSLILLQLNLSDLEIFI